MRSAALLTLLCAPILFAADLDHDGLDDQLEQQLLEKFQPRFLISATDCDARPARFRPSSGQPQTADRDGTLYGQAFPHPGGSLNGGSAIELHYYHLWARDCGRPAHDLDPEHVSALLHRTSEIDAPVAAARGSAAPPSAWTAVYWYAAAHEDTVCDASFAARAETLEATRTGPRIWISEGKHASFLAPELCAAGCGSDRCERMVTLAPPRIINLGEAGAPLNGATWTASSDWPLAAKLGTDFAPHTIDLLEDAPAGTAVSLSASPAGMRNMILTTNRTAGALLVSGSKTGSALARTDGALENAQQTTVEAVGESVEQSGAAVAVSIQETGSATSRSLEETGSAMGATLSGTRRSLKQAGSSVIRWLRGGD